MSRQQGEVTVLTKANTRSNSLRTTIPISIIRQFGLTEGSHLRWEIKARQDSLFVIVSPIDNGSD
jgi:hypothetical protein